MHSRAPLPETDSPSSLHLRVLRREYGGKLNLHSSELQGDLRKRLDTQYRSLVSDLEAFQRSLQLDSAGRPAWRDVHRAVRNLLSGLLDVSNPDHVFHLSHEQKQQRQTFVSLKGVHLVLRLFEPPFLNLNATADFFNDHMELWNEVLVLLRETCFAVPSLAEQVIADEYLVIFFCMLKHSAIFENTMNLLEEVLAVRSDTFRLDAVPDFYALVRGFNCRQLAHFCRVLALVLFEPEDRHIMETSAPLRAFELLRLRRERLNRGGTLVERNQALVINAPDLMARLVMLMRVMNYGPNLHDLLRNNIAVQNATLELMGIFDAGSAGDWEYFRSLLDLARNEPRAANDPEEHASMEELMEAFSATLSPTAFPQAALRAVITVADRLGIARLTPQGFVPHAGPARSGREARRILQFHAILLQAHQVELMFVLSTLMCGRRKVAVQQQLADLNIVEVLSTMFQRLSWDAPPYTGPNPLEHIHGPGCECNPESALRVQCVRLIHHYFERDFENNPLKATMLSAKERALIAQGPDAEHGWQVSSEQDRGLLSQIIHVYLNEPPDSSYRFWLSSVLEAFVRGNGRNEQLFVASSGVLENILDMLLEGVHVDHVSNMQSSFDLLGELVKGNVRVLEMMERYLEGAKLEQFFDRMLDNLVDSSVLLRCIYSTLERYQERWSHREPIHAIRAFSAPGYLTHSWVQFAPALEHRAKPHKSRAPADAKKGSLFGTVKTALAGMFSNWSLSHRDDCSSDEEDTPATATSRHAQAALKPEREHRTAASTTTSSEEQAVPDVPGIEERPAEISRVVELFAGAKTKVLHKLMLSVTIQNISHENVCCLNTALILLISAWARGALSQQLQELREYQNQVHEQLAAASASSGSRSSPPRHYSDAESDHVDLDESADVFVNFRELLWFWCEYYLRRGRDRLSLEFSSHIPFYAWHEVVKALTADDGAETSLLAQPILLPMSPYMLPTQVSPPVFSCL